MPAALAVEDQLLDALAVLRVIVLVNSIGLNLWRWQNYDRPAAGALALVVMVVWTAYVVWAYGEHRRRRAALLIADLAVAMTLMGLSPLLKGPDLNATVPGFWVMGVLIAWAIVWGWKGGLVAAACLSVVDVWIRPEITQTNYGNVFLLMLGGPIIGYACESLKRMAVERDEAQRAAAIAEERTRLARAVHDGVLQVLSLVQRRGSELGGDFADLARMAGVQEAELRALIRRQDAVGSTPGGGGDRRVGALADLVSGLERLASPAVTVALPPGEVLLAADRAGEITAVVQACLDNVRAHVGGTAPAWVLLEVVDDRIVLSVRDEGPGIADGRLAAAEAEGRLGVSQSIRGRVADLGGTAELATGSFGTEWEFTIPR